MDYTMKLTYQSHFWYNDGLKKANIRDLTGAIASLRRSLQYNRGNIAARNLLGLCYYGRGEVVEALVEWILSKNFQSHDNIANYYISKIQEVPGELEAINQAVKRFNQSIEYAKDYSEDMAIIQLKKAVAEHPTYVKAYQLLALCYIHTEQYANARTALRAAHKLDTTDPITLSYMHELNQLRKSRAEILAERKMRQGGQTVSYKVGNDTIIQPSHGNIKEQSAAHTVVNIIIGAAVGIAIMWFLVMPAILSSRQKEINQQTVAFSDQIATQEAQISALKKELEEYRASSEAGEQAVATAESTQESYEIVMDIYDHMKANDMSDNAMLEQMLKVNPDSLGTEGRGRYDSIVEELYPRMCDNIYATAKANCEVANYSMGIENLEKIMLMDEGYDEGGAMLLLAKAYEKTNEQDKANLLYQKILEDFKGKDVAKDAQKALKAQQKKANKEENKNNTEE